MVRRLIQPLVSVTARLVGTGLGTGLSPVAPGTVGSLAALAVYIFSPLQGDSLGLYLLILIGFPLGVWATGTLAGPFNRDPRRAVWDEFVGMWVTCLLVPKEEIWMVGAFCCFRFFDVVKPWPIRRLERLPGGLGIMSDDLLAGVYGAVLLNTLRLTLVN